MHKITLAWLEFEELLTAQELTLTSQVRKEGLPLT